MQISCGSRAPPGNPCPPGSARKTTSFQLDNGCRASMSRIPRRSLGTREGQAFSLPEAILWGRLSSLPLLAFLERQAGKPSPQKPCVIPTKSDRQDAGPPGAFPPRRLSCHLFPLRESTTQPSSLSLSETPALTLLLALSNSSNFDAASFSVPTCS